MATSQETTWAMPAWMEPYRQFLREPKRAEEWMNRSDVNMFNNGPACIMQTATQEGVYLLMRLREAGLLPSTPCPDEIYVVDATEYGEEVAAFVSEDQAKEYAELRGLMHYDVPLCDEATGRRMVEQAGEDD